eukprot:1149254-Pelagomonas_calceolata.AAC.9
MTCPQVCCKQGSKPCFLAKHQSKFEGSITLGVLPPKHTHSHTCTNCTCQVYGFYEECLRKYGSARVWQVLTDLFDFLPLAAVIENQLFCPHAGLSPSMDTLDQINQIHRFEEVSMQEQVCRQKMHLRNFGPFWCHAQMESKHMPPHPEDMLRHMPKAAHFQLHTRRAHGSVGLVLGKYVGVGVQYITLYNVIHIHYNQCQNCLRRFLASQTAEYKNFDSQLALMSTSNEKQAWMVLDDDGKQKQAGGVVSC